MHAGSPRSGVRDVSIPASLPSTRLLLACGLVFPLLWIAMDGVAALAYDGYDYLDQTISELSAVGAPTRTFWLVGGVFYGILEIAFAAFVFGGRFRVHSDLTALAMLVFGFIASSYASDVPANEPTPWLGVYERVNAFGYMLWIVVFSAVLLRLQRSSPRHPGSR